MLVPSKTADPYRHYRGNQVFTSSPTELVVMLFDGALRFVRQAAAALKEQDYAGAHLYPGRAPQSVAELMASLDFKQGELSRNLFKLYEYIHFRLTEADIGRSGEPLGEVETMLLSLRESWTEVSRLSGRSGKERNQEAGY
ncbi:MAG: flagellar export chaperone FliS [Dethiobacteria bacterium]